MSNVATLAGGLWPQSSTSLGVRRTSRPAPQRSLGTISSSRCQTTRAIANVPWRGRCTRRGFVFGRASWPVLGRKFSGIDRRDRRWWSQTGSNRRPPACKAGALPTELWPRASQRNLGTQQSGKWWAWEDLNFRPHAYQARALTN